MALWLVPDPLCLMFSGGKQGRSHLLDGLNPYITCKICLSLAHSPPVLLPESPGGGCSTAVKGCLQPAVRRPDDTQVNHYFNVAAPHILAIKHIPACLMFPGLESNDRLSQQTMDPG